jgi:hypothetical protein
MTQEELSDELHAAQPQPDDVIYIERRGEAFAWACTGGDTTAHTWNLGEPLGLPDAWIYYSGPWPLDDLMRWESFFDELIEEMNSMARSAPRNRSRWPLGDPWPQRR